MSDFTFLTEDQVWKLDILKKYGTKCAITDFSILLGGFVFDDWHTNEGNSRKDRTGYWWTKTPDDGDARAVYNDGDSYDELVSCRQGGARPALPYSSISSIASNEVKGSFGIKEVEYGEYPQTIVDEGYSRELERLYNIGNIRKTGKSYTTDSVCIFSFDDVFKARQHTEYEYNGRKYIRIDGYYYDKELSDGRKVKDGKPYWVAVEPITWLVDERANIALSKKLIFSGVQFKNRRDYKGDFDRTDIKQFMDRYFSKEIVTSKINCKKIEAEKTNSGIIIKTSKNIDKKILVRNRILENTNSNVLVLNNSSKGTMDKVSSRKCNPYSFNFDEVSEENIIKGAIESNISVFLHGKSSDGKSARVKQLDPDCEVIYMRNATPDSFNGKSVYNSVTGEMIDVAPTWYLNVKKKCKAEPNKIHIIFFDELTNALPSIQGMAFNVILDGEVNGKWKLPPNARIVAAGNDLNDSLAANQMAEPLFNRFAHVYIDTTPDEWLKWASTPSKKYERLDYKNEEYTEKIHPSILSFITYKSYLGYDVLRTPYTGDKPNADPRKWEMASKILFVTKQPEMLRSLIGDSLTREFIEFTKKQVITVEDVINHNYSNIDLEMDTAQKFATAVGLSSVDDKHFEVVRDFMKLLGEEPCTLFESIWSNGDERRLEKIAEARVLSKIKRWT